MNADTKREMLVGVRAGYIETKRILKDCFVPIGGKGRKQHSFALSDDRIVEGIVLLGVAQKMSHWRDPANHLVHGVVDQFRILP